MALLLSIAIPFLLLYLLFLAWYGGNGKPMTAAESERFMLEIAERIPGDVMVNELRGLIAKDDGKEFVMHNLARYRPKAMYPPGFQFDDDARAADKRYGKAIIWPLLRQGSLPIFIAKRTGSFIEPDGADAWHYVAMVRYRSRRDFLKFALAIGRADIVVHKWAALEKTHVFPVKPLVSLVYVRFLVAALLALAGSALFFVAR
jgi:hypothetical protein